jgi:hypothetical protein
MTAGHAALDACYRLLARRCLDLAEHGLFAAPPDLWSIEPPSELEIEFEGVTPLGTTCQVHLEPILTGSEAARKVESRLAPMFESLLETFPEVEPSRSGPRLDRADLPFLRGAVSRRRADLADAVDRLEGACFGKPWLAFAPPNDDGGIEPSEAFGMMQALYLDIIDHGLVDGSPPGLTAEGVTAEYIIGGLPWVNRGFRSRAGIAGRGSARPFAPELMD